MFIRVMLIHLYITRYKHFITSISFYTCLPTEAFRLLRHHVYHIPWSNLVMDQVMA